MKKIRSLLLVLLLTAAGCAAGQPAGETSAPASSVVPSSAASVSEAGSAGAPSAPSSEAASSQAAVVVGKITEHEPGFSSATWQGDYGFDEFIAQGGAKNDAEMVAYLSKYMATNDLAFSLGGACSAVQAKSADGYLFGRNFDWSNCPALVLVSRPASGYASVSTVNLEFVTGNLKGSLTDAQLLFAAHYAPLDGVNEKGLCVSVNMVADNPKIDQNTDKPDITTTTAVRYMLNHAATVDEALTFLRGRDMHASMGVAIHYMIADAAGRSVCVEYIDNEMKVVDAKMVTNFYQTIDKTVPGDGESRQRYAILEQAVAGEPLFTAAGVMDLLSRVSKKNFNPAKSTEWSVVYDQQTGHATYCHREDYTKRYDFDLK